MSDLRLMSVSFPLYLSIDLGPSYISYNVANPTRRIIIQSVTSYIEEFSLKIIRPSRVTLIAYGQARSERCV